MLVGIYKGDEGTEYTGQVNVERSGSRYLCRYHLSNCINSKQYIQGEFEIDNKRVAPVIKKLTKIVNSSKSQKAH